MDTKGSLDTTFRQSILKGWQTQSLAVMGMERADQQTATRQFKRRWYQYSLRTLLLFVFVCSLPCSWLAMRLERAKRQREAVAALCAIEDCEVCYEYDPQTAHTDLARHFENWPDPPEPTWLEELLGAEIFHQALTVHIGCDDVEQALPHLLRLPYLKQVFIDAFNQGEYEPAFQRLAPHLPGVKIEWAYPHLLEFSKIPVVG